MDVMRHAVMRTTLLLMVLSLILFGGVATTQDDDSPRFCESLIAFVAQGEPYSGFFLIDPNTGEIRQIMEEYETGLIELTVVEWSSDGSQLLVNAFNADDPVTLPVGYIYDLATESVTPVTPLGNTFIKWSYDDKFIAGQVAPTLLDGFSQINITALDRDDDPPHITIDHGVGFGWVANSLTLYYVNTTESVIQSIDLSVPNPEPIHVLDVRESIRQVIPSPDGEILVMFDQQDGLLTYDVNTMTSSPVQAMRPFAFIRWLSDSQNYVYADINGDISLVGRYGRQVQSLNNGFFGGDGVISTDPVKWVELSPQETHLLFRTFGVDTGDALYIMPLRSDVVPEEITQLIQVEDGWIDSAAWSPCLDTED